MKKILATFIGTAVGIASVIGLSAGLGGCSRRGENELVIGYTLYAPMNYMDGGKLVGFDTEFAEIACAELGYTPVFQIIDWDNKVSELKTKQIDLIWNGMTITDELSENIAITDSYMENKQVVVVKSGKADKFTDIESVSSASSVAVESGSAGESVIRAQNSGVTINPMQAQSDCLLEVKTGNSEIAIIDITMARAMTGAGTDFSDLTYIDVGFEGEDYGIGMRKEDTDLLAALNGLIAKYKTDGTFDALVAKYML